MSWKKKLTTCALLGGTAAGIMHVVNRLVYYISTIDNLLYHKDEKYYDWRFGRIFYTKQGSGSPILLIHDLNVISSSCEWEKVVETLAQTNTVYTIDLLGCGRSDKPNLTYTNYLYVQLVTDFIKHIISSKTDVIATGESGTFVLMACANDNTIIDKVMLVNPQNLVTLAKIPTKRTKILRHFISTPIIGTFAYNMLVNKRTIEDKKYHDLFRILTQMRHTLKVFIRKHEIPLYKCKRTALPKRPDKQHIHHRRQCQSRKCTHSKPIPEPTAIH